MSKPVDYEISFEQEMTKEKLREMLHIVENAEKNAVPGQTLRLKVNHNTSFVFREIGKISVSKGMTYESKTIQ